MTLIKIGPGSVAEYIVEQGDGIFVTARKLAGEVGDPTGEGTCYMLLINTEILCSLAQKQLVSL